MIKKLKYNSVNLQHCGHCFIYTGPPTTVISNCEVKGDNISISWKQPDSNGAVITEYKVYQRRGNEEEWTGIKKIENNFTHKYVVTDLDKGKEYEFLITARNTYGESIKEGNCERVKVPGGKHNLFFNLHLPISVRGISVYS